MKHRGTKILSLLLMLVLLIGVLPGMSAFAEPQTWPSGDTTVTYDTSTKILTISGTGAMAGYANATQVPWRSYRASIQSVVIDDGVTSIGTYAFCNSSKMTSVSIPSSVTSIGMNAFYGCSSLTSVVIPNGVTSIGAYAFNRCRALTSVVIPNGVTSIGAYAFSSCAGLDGTNLNIPGSVTSIGENAFNGVDFTSVTFEPGVNGTKLTIGDNAFFHYNNSTRLAYGSGNAKLYYENGNEVLERTLMNTLSNKTLTWKSGFTVTLSGGANATTSGGATIQTGLTGAMTTVTYTANNGYTFPAFSNSTTNGVTLTRASDTVVTVSGTPTADVNITVPDAAAIPTYTVSFAANGGSGSMASVTVNAGSTYNLPACDFTAPTGKQFKAWSYDGKEYAVGTQFTINSDATFIAVWQDSAAPVANKYTVTYVANNGSGETKTYGPYDAGTTYTVEGCSFAAPEGKVFDCWKGSDGKTYKVGSPVVLNANLTLKAQWKDEEKPDDGEKKTSGGGSGFDLVFNIPGADNSWEYVGGYAPQQAYRVSLAPMQGGSAALGLTTGESTETAMNVYPTTTVYVFPNAEQGYVLDKIVWSLIDGSASYDITEAKNFVMPAMDVVVYVTFRPVG